ncbi:hypothetical protein CALVIDRAFT_515151 [Calocera viscosa TUFC12733]|uniref:CHY-type domain-containing protein n=1 Tax=Calocera viscosa (strain TUFC12733) TaxID=1330018 RepID=A0A167M431_CALVF|nr:hypothetical protein CALVIDRAFT_515151 [Calocera viscosa TUFC12733]
MLVTTDILNKANCASRLPQLSESVVLGVGLDAQTRCNHWHGPSDIIALRFKCCGQFYACHACHVELADHEPIRYRVRDDPEVYAVLCGVCSHEHTVDNYLGREGDCCAKCGASWNPGCRLHTKLYFDPS